MDNFMGVQISLPKLEGVQFINCFAVFCNCRVNLPYAFDPQQQLLTIHAPVNPQWLIVVDTSESSFEFYVSNL